MALEPITNSSTVSSSTVQSGKNNNTQATQQDISSSSQASGFINAQAQDVAAMYNAQQNLLSDESKSKMDSNVQWLKNAVTDTNNKIKMTWTRCEFSYNDEINRVAIKVVDSETDKVIREIPPEETLKVIQKLWEIAGLVVDERR